MGGGAPSGARPVAPLREGGARDRRGGVGVQHGGRLGHVPEAGAAPRRALAVLVVTALALLWLGRVDLGRWSFVTAKLWIGILVIAPMEAIDIYLSHLGGNKAGIRRTGDLARYERMVSHHTRFLYVTEPIVVVIVPLLFVLAIAKPF